jgi:hypothetical protein
MAAYRYFYDPPVIQSTSLDALREQLLGADSPDGSMIMHVGHFTTWFAGVEYTLTILLRRLTAVRSPTMFRLLSHGMDAKVKVTRIIEASAASIPMGPNLKLRLNHFQNCHVPIRNKLVHSLLTWRPGTVPGLLISGADSPPTHGKPPRSGYKEPDFIAADRLFEYGMWLKGFAMDVGDLVREADLEILERDAYRASLPKGHPQGSPA